MAQLVLGIGGSAAGNALLPSGISLFGAQISGATIGGFAGTMLGAGLDRQLIGGASRHGPRLTDLHVQTSTEGASIPLLFGRARLSGQVIWAARLTEHAETVPTGGKGGGPSRTDYRYSVSFAVGLCEGEIAGISHVWANGAPLDLAGLNCRIYRGSEDQSPDALIEAIEGAANTPAYRGLAYVVFEDLPLDAFGGRIPNLSFEVFRPARPSSGSLRLEERITGVDLIPASGEFSYATQAVVREAGLGRDVPENVNNLRGLPDFIAAIDDLEAQLPQCRSILLVTAWFGDDLRCGECRIRPGVETRDKITHPLTWSAAGEDRATAWLVTQEEGRPVYGGTPSDETLIAAMAELKARGFSVSLYPFILMDITAGNGLPDPWGGTEQAAYPWRGRISCHPAPGEAGSVDQTAEADAQVAAFFGSAAASGFAVAGGAVSYSGPAEWSFRRFILHHAALAKAGGADGFLIGSEMRGLTRVRGESGFPAVNALCDLAAEARLILGGGVRLSYAADWSEYFGYHPDDGSGDVWFHLDCLWSHPAIDAVAIDWYAPLSDWRDGHAHLDAGLAATPHDPAYLEANVEGGQGFDWYYASAADRLAQIRTPITDGGAGKPFVFRYKDIAGWWSNPHFDRPGGVEAASPTAWVPQSKPIWITEVGCPAVDKGANQPNVFTDPKSAESRLPHFSSGRRDDLIQRRYLEAVIHHWGPAAGHNPVSPLYGGPMIDPDAIHVWTWDARPFPDFPARSEIWADGANWRLGHWMTGRAGLATLADTVAEITGLCALDADVSSLDGLVTGYVIDGPVSGRAALETLAGAFGFRLSEGGAGVRFVAGGPDGVTDIAPGDLVLPDRGEVLQRLSSPAALLPENVRLRHIGDAEDYEIATAHARLTGQAGGLVHDLAWPLVADDGQARQWARDVLLDAHGRDERIAFALPPSWMALEPGDAIRIEGEGDGEIYQIDTASGAEARQVQASGWIPRAGTLRGSEPGHPGPAGRVSRPALALLDMPLLAEETGDRNGVLVAAYADPWPGQLALHAGPDENSLTARGQIGQRAAIGETLTGFKPGPAGRWAGTASVDIRLEGGHPASADALTVLNGANRLALRHEAGWTVFHFLGANLQEDGSYRLTGLLHGDLETPAEFEPGSDLVLLDRIPETLKLAGHERGEALVLRAGAARLPVQSQAYTQTNFTYAGRDLAPLSPVHLKWTQTEAGHLFHWIRRGRFGGDDWSAPDIPVGEARLAFQVCLFDGDVLVAEHETMAASFLLPPEMAASLYPPPPGNPRIRVAQISDRHGAGRAAEASFSL